MKYKNQGTDGIIYANLVPQTGFYQFRKVFTPVKALHDCSNTKPIDFEPDSYFEQYKTCNKL